MVNIGEKVLIISLCSLLNVLLSRILRGCQYAKRNLFFLLQIIVKVELYSNFFFGGENCMREGERDRNEDDSSNKKEQRLFKGCSKSTIKTLEKGFQNNNKNTRTTSRPQNHKNDVSDVILVLFC